MNLQFFQSTPSITIIALLSGFIFGFLLQKAAVYRFDVIIGQFLLKDFTVMKVILTAIVVGSVGIYSLHAVGIIPKLLLSKTPIIFSLLGGSVFGVGMAISGYCPGTGIAALASGSKDVLVGLAGMIFGSIIFNELSYKLLPLINQQDSAYQQTIGSYFTRPSGVVIIALIGLWSVFFLWRKNTEQKIDLSNQKS